MITLTLSTGEHIHINLKHIVAVHQSRDEGKSGVTVVYTMYQQFPFEVKETAVDVANWMRSGFAPFALKKQAA